MNGRTTATFGTVQLEKDLCKRKKEKEKMKQKTNDNFIT